MTLQTELERVREYLTGANPPPMNEANTCDWIIAPLLRQCGYHYHDIHAQARAFAESGYNGSNAGREGDAA